MCVNNHNDVAVQFVAMPVRKFCDLRDSKKIIQVS